jgi:hypothetical protein
MSKQTKYEFQVALSFAGEDRKVAEQLAKTLRERGVAVFYDEFAKSTLWGKDLYQHLQTIYKDRAQYCVVLVSQHYIKKNWTKHELKQAQARSFSSDREYILPLRLDDTSLPGLAPTIGYLDLRNTTLPQVAVLLLEKLGLPSDGLTDEMERAEWDGEFVTYNGVKVAKFWPKQIEKAQTEAFYLVTAPAPRIRHGDERDWKRTKNLPPCHDCAALQGQFHVPGCDMEECPLCHGQNISCGCHHESISAEKLERWEEDDE